ncbi:MAG: heavy-metal-associated domain-containing protein [Myxococcales bacterium]|nr:heavy-metal-associated domain-containing protein [Myxococcales bacterium]
MPGVRTAKVNFDKKEALVEFDAKKATIVQMSAALNKAGYTGSLKSWPKG